MADQSHSRPEVHGCSVFCYDMACCACMVYVVGILGVSREAFRLTVWFNVFQVLQETVARRRRDRTAPHDFVVM